MSAFFPTPPRAVERDTAHPHFLERSLDRDEQRARWEVRTAQWRARELAEAVFGSVAESSVRALRPAGAARGLMVLRVPFQSLSEHRDREARFMAAAERDPVLSAVPLVYVFGADHG